VRFWRGGLILSFLPWFWTPLNAAPISFNTALPVHKSGLLIRQQVDWTQKHKDPSSLDREMDVTAFTSVFVYGVTSKLALIGVIPILDKELEARATGTQRESTGLGDVSTTARYQVFERNRSGQTWRGAVLGGLKWPTGKNKESDGLGRLPPPVQSGTGSYDPFVGTVWSTLWLSGELDADLVYRRNTRANSFKFGDVIQSNFSYQHRFWPRVLKSEGVPHFFYAVLEANNIYQEKNEAGSTKNNNSGGYQLFITPGLQWVTQRTVLELASQLPAIQDLNGTTLETNVRLITSFRIWF